MNKKKYIVLLAVIIILLIIVNASINRKKNINEYEINNNVNEVLQQNYTQIDEIEIAL